MSEGVLYIVLNESRLLKEAIYSATTLKYYSPKIKSCIITNLHLTKTQSKVFDLIIMKNDNLHPLKLKVSYLKFSPFKKTLFLDADTALLKNIDGIFDLLKNFDFAFTFDNLCDWKHIPPLFLAQESEDINTGFILYNNNQISSKVFDFWFAKIFHQKEDEMSPGNNCDQIYFNKYILPFLELHNYSYTILSNEIYNVRPCCWELLKKQNKWLQVKILHAHDLNLSIIDKIKRKLFFI